MCSCASFFAVNNIICEIKHVHDSTAWGSGRPARAKISYNKNHSHKKLRNNPHPPQKKSKTVGRPFAPFAPVLSEINQYQMSNLHIGCQKDSKRLKDRELLQAQPFQFGLWAILLPRQVLATYTSAPCRYTEQVDW